MSLPQASHPSLHLKVLTSEMDLAEHFIYSIKGEEEPAGLHIM
jgi:hypothetical protein